MNYRNGPKFISLQKSSRQLLSFVFMLSLMGWGAADSTPARAAAPAAAPGTVEIKLDEASLRGFPPERETNYTPMKVEAYGEDVVGFVFDQLMDGEVAAAEAKRFTSDRFKFHRENETTEGGTKTKKVFESEFELQQLIKELVCNPQSLKEERRRRKRIPFVDDDEILSPMGKLDWGKIEEALRNRADDEERGTASASPPSTSAGSGRVARTPAMVVLDRALEELVEAGEGDGAEEGDWVNKGEAVGAAPVGIEVSGLKLTDKGKGRFKALARAAMVARALARGKKAPDEDALEGAAGKLAERVRKRRRSAVDDDDEAEDLGMPLFTIWPLEDGGGEETPMGGVAGTGVAEQLAHEMEMLIGPPETLRRPRKADTNVGKLIAALKPSLTSGKIDSSKRGDIKAALEGLSGEAGESDDDFGEIFRDALRQVRAKSGGDAASANNLAFTALAEALDEIFPEERGGMEADVSTPQTAKQKAKQRVRRTLDDIANEQLEQLRFHFSRAVSHEAGKLAPLGAKARLLLDTKAPKLLDVGGGEAAQSAGGASSSPDARAELGKRMARPPGARATHTPSDEEGAIIGAFVSELPGVEEHEEEPIIRVVAKVKSRRGDAEQFKAVNDALKALEDKGTLEADVKQGAVNALVGLIKKPRYRRKPGGDEEETPFPSLELLKGLVRELAIGGDGRLEPELAELVAEALKERKPRTRRPDEEIEDGDDGGMLGLFLDALKEHLDDEYGKLAPQLAAVQRATGTPSPELATLISEAAGLAQAGEVLFDPDQGGGFREGLKAGEAKSSPDQKLVQELKKKRNRRTPGKVSPLGPLELGLVWGSRPQEKEGPGGDDGRSGIVGFAGRVKKAQAEDPYIDKIAGIVSQLREGSDKPSYDELNDAADALGKLIRMRRNPGDDGDGDLGPLDQLVIDLREKFGEEKGHIGAELAQLVAHARKPRKDRGDVTDEEDDLIYTPFLKALEADLVEQYGELAPKLSNAGAATGTLDPELLAQVADFAAASEALYAPDAGGGFRDGLKKGTAGWKPDEVFLGALKKKRNRRTAPDGPEEKDDWDWALHFGPRAQDEDGGGGAPGKARLAALAGKVKDAALIARVARFLEKAAREGFDPNDEDKGSALAALKAAIAARKKSDRDGDADSFRPEKAKKLIEDILNAGGGAPGVGGGATSGTDAGKRERVLAELFEDADLAEASGDPTSVDVGVMKAALAEVANEEGSGLVEDGDAGKKLKGRGADLVPLLSRAAARLRLDKETGDLRLTDDDGGLLDVLDRQIKFSKDSGGAVAAPAVDDAISSDLVTAALAKVGNGTAAGEVVDKFIGELIAARAGAGDAGAIGGGGDEDEGVDDKEDLGSLIAFLEKAASEGFDPDDENKGSALAALKTTIAARKKAARDEEGGTEFGEKKAKKLIEDILNAGGGAPGVGGGATSGTDAGKRERVLAELFEDADLAEASGDPTSVDVGVMKAALAEVLNEEGSGLVEDGDSGKKLKGDGADLIPLLSRAAARLRLDKETGDLRLTDDDGGLLDVLDRQIKFSKDSGGAVAAPAVDDAISSDLVTAALAKVGNGTAAGEVVDKFIGELIAARAGAGDAGAIGGGGDEDEVVDDKEDLGSLIAFLEKAASEGFDPDDENKGSALAALKAAIAARKKSDRDGDADSFRPEKAKKLIEDILNAGGGASGVGGGATSGTDAGKRERVLAELFEDADLAEASGDPTSVDVGVMKAALAEVLNEEGSGLVEDDGAGKKLKGDGADLIPLLSRAAARLRLDKDTGSLNLRDDDGGLLDALDRQITFSKDSGGAAAAPAAGDAISSDLVTAALAKVGNGTAAGEVVDKFIGELIAARAGAGDAGAIGGGGDEDEGVDDKEDLGSLIAFLEKAAREGFDPNDEDKGSALAALKAAIAARKKSDRDGDADSFRPEKAKKLIEDILNAGGGAPGVGGGATSGTDAGKRERVLAELFEDADLAEASGDPTSVDVGVMKAALAEVANEEGSGLVEDGDAGKKLKGRGADLVPLLSRAAARLRLDKETGDLRLTDDDGGLLDVLDRQIKFSKDSGGAVAAPAVDDAISSDLVTAALAKVGNGTAAGEVVDKFIGELIAARAGAGDAGAIGGGGDEDEGVDDKEDLGSLIAFLEKAASEGFDPDDENKGSALAALKTTIAARKKAARDEEGGTEFGEKKAKKLIEDILNAGGGAPGVGGGATSGTDAGKRERVLAELFEDADLAEASGDPTSVDVGVMKAALAEVLNEEGSGLVEDGDSGKKLKGDGADLIPLLSRAAARLRLDKETGDLRLTDDDGGLLDVLDRQIKFSKDSGGAVAAPAVDDAISSDLVTAALAKVGNGTAAGEVVDKFIGELIAARAGAGDAGAIGGGGDEDEVVDDKEDLGSLIAFLEKAASEGFDPDDENKGSALAALKAAIAARKKSDRDGDADSFRPEKAKKLIEDILNAGGGAPGVGGGATSGTDAGKRERVLAELFEDADLAEASGDPTSVDVGVMKAALAEVLNEEGSGLVEDDGAGKKLKGDGADLIPLLSRAAARLRLDKDTGSLNLRDDDGGLLDALDRQITFSKDSGGAAAAPAAGDAISSDLVTAALAKVGNGTGAGEIVDKFIGELIAARAGAGDAGAIGGGGDEDEGVDDKEDLGSLIAFLEKAASEGFDPDDENKGSALAALKTAIAARKKAARDEEGGNEFGEKKAKKLIEDILNAGGSAPGVGGGATSGTDAGKRERVLAELFEDADLAEASGDPTSVDVGVMKAALAEVLNEEGSGLVEDDGAGKKLKGDGADLIPLLSRAAARLRFGKETGVLNLTDDDGGLLDVLDRQIKFSKDSGGAAAAPAAGDAISSDLVTAALAKVGNGTAAGEIVDKFIGELIAARAGAGDAGAIGDGKTSFIEGFVALFEKKDDEDQGLQDDTGKAVRKLFKAEFKPSGALMATDGGVDGDGDKAALDLLARGLRRVNAPGDGDGDGEGSIFGSSAVVALAEALAGEGEEKLEDGELERARALLRKLGDRLLDSDIGENNEFGITGGQGTDAEPFIFSAEATPRMARAAAVSLMLRQNSDASDVGDGELIGKLKERGRGKGEAVEGLEDGSLESALIVARKSGRQADQKFDDYGSALAKLEKFKRKILDLVDNGDDEFKDAVTEYDELVKLGFSFSDLKSFLEEDKTGSRLWVLGNAVRLGKLTLDSEANQLEKDLYNHLNKLRARKGEVDIRQIVEGQIKERAETYLSELLENDGVDNFAKYTRSVLTRNRAAAGGEKWQGVIAEITGVNDSLSWLEKLYKELLIEEAKKNVTKKVFNIIAAHTNADKDIDRFEKELIRQLAGEDLLARRRAPTAGDDSAKSARILPLLGVKDDDLDLKALKEQLRSRRMPSAAGGASGTVGEAVDEKEAETIILEELEEIAGQFFEERGSPGVEGALDVDGGKLTRLLERGLGVPGDVDITTAAFTEDRIARARKLEAILLANAISRRKLGSPEDSELKDKLANFLSTAEDDVMDTFLEELRKRKPATKDDIAEQDYLGSVLDQVEEAVKIVMDFGDDKTAEKNKAVANAMLVHALLGLIDGEKIPETGTGRDKLKRARLANSNNPDNELSKAFQEGVQNITKSGDGHYRVLDFVYTTKVKPSYAILLKSHRDFGEKKVELSSVEGDIEIRDKKKRSVRNINESSRGGGKESLTPIEISDRSKPSLFQGFLTILSASESNTEVAHDFLMLDRSKDIKIGANGFKLNLIKKIWKEMEDDFHSLFKPRSPINANDRKRIRALYDYLRSKGTPAEVAKRLLRHLLCMGEQMSFWQKEDESTFNSDSRTELAILNCNPLLGDKQLEEKIHGVERWLVATSTLTFHKSEPEEEVDLNEVFKRKYEEKLTFWNEVYELVYGVKLDKAKFVLTPHYQKLYNLKETDRSIISKRDGEYSAFTFADLSLEDSLDLLDEIERDLMKYLPLKGSLFDLSEDGTQYVKRERESIGYREAMLAIGEIVERSKEFLSPEEELSNSFRLNQFGQLEVDKEGVQNAMDRLIRKITGATDLSKNKLNKDDAGKIYAAIIKALQASPASSEILIDKTSTSKIKQVVANLLKSTLKQPEVGGVLVSLVDSGRNDGALISLIDKSTESTRETILDLTFNSRKRGMASSAGESGALLLDYIWKHMGVVKEVKDLYTVSRPGTGESDIGGMRRGEEKKIRTNVFERFSQFMHRNKEDTSFTKLLTSFDFKVEGDIREADVVLVKKQGTGLAKNICEEDFYKKLKEEVLWEDDLPREYLAGAVHQMIMSGKTYLEAGKPVGFEKDPAIVFKFLEENITIPTFLAENTNTLVKEIVSVLNSDQIDDQLLKEKLKTLVDARKERFGGDNQGYIALISNLKAILFKASDKKAELFKALNEIGWDDGKLPFSALFIYNLKKSSEDKYWDCRT